MTREHLGNIGDFVGGIGVVISLLYLASQIRQNTNSVRGASELESERMRMEWHSIPADGPDLDEIWDKVFQTPNEVTWQELGRFRWFIASYFHILESSWLQHRRGLLDENGWIPLQAAMLGLLKNPTIAAWWDEEGSPFSRDFRSFVQDLRDENVDLGWRYQSHIDAHSRQTASSPGSSKDAV